MILLLGLLACGPGPADTAAAERAVRAFFDGIGREDCAAVVPIAAGGWTEEGCLEYARDYREHHMRLEAIHGAYVDGRDPDAVVVRAEFVRGGQHRKALVRVIREGRAYKVQR